MELFFGDFIIVIFINNSKELINFLISHYEFGFDLFK
jgi:hypothetical protein